MGNHPLIVEVYRGDVVESTHQVHCIAIDKDGDILECRGDPERLISSRSSLKPLQAIPFVETGAVDALGLGDEEIALACASHNAEEVHVQKIRSWLEHIGLSETNLVCGGHLSLSETRAHEMIRHGEAMTALFSDCSGKHAGMLSTAKHQGHRIEGYEARTHPVQKQISEVISEMADYDLSKGHWGTDGCSVPNPAIPLKNLAYAFRYFISPADLNQKRTESCRRILDAMAAYPYLLAGAERFDTDIAQVSEGCIIAKMGAEGNCVVFVRDKGIVLYLKAEDGVFCRATQPAAGFMLHKFGAITPQVDEALSGYIRPVLKNWTGLPVGKIVVR